MTSHFFIPQNKKKKAFVINECTSEKQAGWLDLLHPADPETGLESRSAQQAKTPTSARVTLSVISPENPGARPPSITGRA